MIVKVCFYSFDFRARVSSFGCLQEGSLHVCHGDEHLNGSCVDTKVTIREKPETDRFTVPLKRSRFPHGSFNGGTVSSDSRPMAHLVYETYRNKRGD